VSNTSAQHVVPNPRTGTGLGNYKIFTDGDTTRCDWLILTTEALLRAERGRELEHKAEALEMERSCRPEL